MLNVSSLCVFFILLWNRIYSKSRSSKVYGFVQIIYRAVIIFVRFKESLQVKKRVNDKSPLKSQDIYGKEIKTPESAKYLGTTALSWSTRNSITFPLQAENLKEITVHRNLQYFRNGGYIAKSDFGNFTDIAHFLYSDSIK